jgi:hypothetical protein
MLFLGILYFPFSSDFPIKNWYAYLVSHACYMPSPYLSEVISDVEAGLSRPMCCCSSSSSSTSSNRRSSSNSSRLSMAAAAVMMFLYQVNTKQAAYSVRGN